MSADAVQTHTGHLGATRCGAELPSELIQIAQNGSTLWR